MSKARTHSAPTHATAPTHARRATSGAPEDTEAAEVPLPVKLPASIVSRLDAAADRINATVPGAKASRSSLMRAIICGQSTLAELEAHGAKGSK